jgi:glucose/arabinose dehydrogenase/PKD repeat protein
MGRTTFLAVLLLLTASARSWGNEPPAAPVITEPATENQLLNFEDVHMETGPFQDPDPGDTHAATDWEIWTIVPNVRVWRAANKTGLERTHIHLGDGNFENSHAGATALLPQTSYVLRVRHKDSSGVPQSQWSPYSTRVFRTVSLTTVFGMELEDVRQTPQPTLVTTTGAALNLPGGSSPASIFIEGAAGELLAEIRGQGSSNMVVNPPALGEHVFVRVRVAAGLSSLSLPQTNITITDATGTDRTIYLPAVILNSFQTARFWVSSNGSTYSASASQTQPDFSSLARGAPVPWSAPPGFKVEIVATGFRLPVNLAFVPNPGPNPGDPLVYVNELYGTVKVVRRNGSVGTFASGLLNFNPSGDFPGSGEMGLTGIVVDPASHDLFVSMLHDDNGTLYPLVVRLHSNDGGQTAASITNVLHFVGEPQGASHQISNLKIGPDGKLLIHVGDGFNHDVPLDLESFRGKILRANLNGTAPADNPFYSGSGGITARDYIWAYGLRNPFGGCWRLSDGTYYMVENGPSTDRLARVIAGRNFGWNGSNEALSINALYNWNPSRAPVNIAFVEPGVFGGSGFPPERMGRAYVTESGPTWGSGPHELGKRIREFVIDSSGSLVGQPADFVAYNGGGKGTACGLAAGPGGLYFTDLYKDFGYNSPTDAGANLLRIRAVGDAAFAADRRRGFAPMRITFTDTSEVPGATGWLWTFGDGAQSTERNPTHTYTTPGRFDVRLEIATTSGTTIRQEPDFVHVGGMPRIAFIGGGSSATPADAAIEAQLRALGYSVERYPDAPAGRPTATALAASFDLAVISSSVTAANIGAEFRAAALPLLFWEAALLQPGRESLMQGGGVAAGANSIQVLNNSHWITRGIPLGNYLIAEGAVNMAVGQGDRPPGTTVLARRSGVGGQQALMIAEEGAQLLDYTAPARRAFIFLDDTNYLSSTSTTKLLLKRAACWAMYGEPSVLTGPGSRSVPAGQSAQLSLVATGARTLQYRWRRNGVNLTDGGRISGAVTPTLSIASVTAADAGSYQCVVSNACGSVISSAATLAVIGGSQCYANCDGSAGSPALTSNDLTCFLQRFLAGDPYTNCDGSAAPPVLTVMDLHCFLDRYRQGCP